MSVSQYFSWIKNAWLREIRYRSLETLKELERVYKVKGHRTWVSYWDDGVWTLTVVL